MTRRLPALLATCLLTLTATSALAQSSTSLLEAGAEPRQPLRYALTAERAESAKLDISTRIAMEVAGTGMPAMAIPTIRMMMALTPTEVSADGTARYEFSIDAVGVMPGTGDAALAGTLSASLDQLAGITGWGRIDNRGQTLEGGIEMPGLDGQIEQVLGNVEQYTQQLTAPLPLEPVGVGARWRAVNDIESGGYQVTQTAEYTLISRSGNQAVLELKVTQTAEPQSVSAPGIPAGLQAELTALESTGSGRISIDLSRMVPVDSSMDLATDTALSLAVAGQTQQLDMSMQMEISISPN